MRKIAFINQKGGVAKTTTCLNVGAGLARKGYSVLLVDIDPQGSLSTSAGYGDIDERALTTYEVIKGDDINKAIKTKLIDYPYDILVTDIRLSGAEMELASQTYYTRLRDAFKRLKKKYDYILVDCPPSLNIFTMMALVAVNEVIIPVEAQYLALKGVAQLQDIINLVKSNFNTNLSICGIMPTFFDPRRSLDQAVVESLSQAFDGKMFKTYISQNTKLAEAPSYGQDIFTYSPTCKGAKQYQALVNEIIDMIPQKESK